MPAFGRGLNLGPTEPAVAASTPPASAAAAISARRRLAFITTPSCRRLAGGWNRFRDVRPAAEPLSTGRRSGRRRRVLLVGRPHDALARQRRDRPRRRAGAAVERAR